MEQVITIVTLIISIILHEMAHAHAANALGDPTARLQGRLSPNPIVHMDPLGSVIIPGLLMFMNAGVLFGWAKPVPYNPYNLKSPWGLPAQAGEGLVAIAGPAANVLLAVIFAVIVRFGDILSLPDSFISLSWYIVYINILLALFNMLPFPPLDGSKILSSILPYPLSMYYQKFVRFVEQYGIFVMFAFIFIFINFFSDPFFVFVSGIVELLTGVSS